MTPDDVPFHEMDGWTRDDDGTDPLDGHHGAGHAGDLALFAEDLRNVFPETALPERVAEDHVAAMIGAFQLLADKGESALEPTSNAHGPDRRASGLPKLRRRTMKEKLILRLTVTTGLLVSSAGLANAGVLPDPIQSTIEDVLGIDGITVDDGDQADVADVADVEDDAVGDVEDADQAAVEDDDQATEDDGTADDADENDQGDADENDQGDVDEGDQGGIEDEDQADVNDGGQADEDEGDQGNPDEGDQGAADESSQNDADGGDEGSADGGSNE